MVQVFLWCPQREPEISLSQREEREGESCLYTMIEGEGGGEEGGMAMQEERWDCRDSLFDGRNAEAERGRGEGAQRRYIVVL